MKRMCLGLTAILGSMALAGCAAQASPLRTPGTLPPGICKVGNDDPRRGASFPSLEIRPGFLHNCALLPLHLLAANLANSRWESTSAAHEIQSPILVRWKPESVVQATGLSRLVLEIKQVGRMDAPIEVSLRLPKGAACDGCERPVQVQPTQAGETHEYEYTVRVLTPSDPVIAVVDAKGNGWGYHAEVPTIENTAVPRVSRDVRDTLLGSRSIGRGVPMISPSTSPPVAVTLTK